eukprot:TRINITY_DN88492_c0_g1_i1.p1 TRINITY_DN88492_c0_g1~~TRINITY_DN88492_c0_g1_i1.p1  ORF type:complete len:565 (-),score=59.89 TRINITY_DN88492_c0_g1_i1:401-1966(-)
MPQLSTALAQFSSWRTTRIRMALITLFAYILTVALTCFGLRGTVASLVTDQLDDKYLQFFAHLTWICKFERWCTLLGFVAAWTMAWLACTSFDMRSISLLRRCVMLNVGVPLVLSVFLPYREGIDVVGFRRNLCEDVILHIQDHPGGLLFGNMILSNVLDGGNSTDVCSSPPWDWGQRLVDFVTHSSRFTVQENCDTKRDADVLGCLDVGAQAGMKTRIECLKDRTGLGRRLGLPGQPTCIRTSELKDLELLADVASQVTAEKMILGVMFGIKSLAVLLPVALAISTGIIHGGQCAMVVLPQSLFPGFVSLTVSMINLPCILVILAFLQSFGGNVFTAFGIAFFVVDYAISTRFWKTVPIAGSTQALLEKTCFQWGVRLVTLSLLLGGMLLHTCLGSVIRLVAVHLMRYPTSPIARVIISLRDVVGWSILSALLVYYGLALLLGVCFADAFVQLTYHLQSVAASQGDESREELWNELECLRQLVDPDNKQVVPRLMQAQMSVCDPHRTLLQFPSCFSSKFL